ncbi:zinc-ribbon domain-containing protein [Actinomyces ruminis]|uniref:zinc-ribbon domain-containing protein n=1 Tax=Actinomyces ruminis TaxID=1937003 RepID=UPI003B847BFD
MSACPRCHTQVAPEARTCPECGYTDSATNRPIATTKVQGEVVEPRYPTDATSIWNPVRDSADFRTLFLNATNLQRTVPSIIDWIRANLGEQYLSPTYLEASRNLSTTER